MRRMLLVAFLTASLLVFPSAFAQHAGHAGGFSGGRGGGSVGHMGGGFAGGSSGRASGFAPRSLTLAPNFVSTAPGRAFAPGYRMPSSASAPAWRGEGHGDHDRDRGRDFRYRSPYRGYGYGYGGYPYVYANSWQLLPSYLDYPDAAGYYDSGSDMSGSEVSESGQQQPPASAPAPDDGYRPDYPGPAEPSYAYAQPPAARPYPQTEVSPEPALTLIFNDGHQQTIHNYVLTSGAVVVLDQAASGRQERIPLASLNLDATQQAAQQAGLDFTPPE